MVSLNQSVLLKGRMLVDSVVVVNEVTGVVKIFKKECIIFKFDFEKAYDLVSWRFLDYMLIRLYFNDKWRPWIKACVFYGNLVVLVNGSPTPKIKIQIGLSHGDSLAHFLFPIVV